MSQTFTFYTFNKKKNSTKVPSYSSTNPQLSIEFKGPYNMHTPKIILDFSGVTDMSSLYQYNYCSTVISGETYYYFIRMKTMLTAQAIAEIELELDYMATFKSAIGNSYALVEYSEDNYDDEIPDSRMVNTTEMLVSAASPGLTWTVFGALGLTIDYVDCCVQLKTISASLSPETSATGFWMTNRTNLATLMNWMNNLGDNPIEAIEKIITKPHQALIGASVIPISYTPSGSYYIELVGQTSTALGDPFGHFYNQYVNVDIPKLFDDWRDINNSYSLYLPFVGYVPIAGRELYNSEKILIEIQFNTASGKIKYKISAYDVIGEYHADCSIPIAIEQINTIESIRGLVTNAPQAMGNVVDTMYHAKKNPLAIAGATISAGTEAVSSILDAGMLDATVIGSGSVTSDWQFNQMNIYLYATAFNTDVPPLSFKAYKGVPCHKIHKISNHSGFIQTTNFHYESGDTTTKAAIESICNGGFYYE